MSIKNLPPSYSLSNITPTPEVYNSLRRDSHLTPFSHEAATLGLRGSLFTVVILYQDPKSEHSAPKPIGMGRVSGDGGCFYQVTDICVLPEHQKKGLGKYIMGQIEKWLVENVPKTGFVTLCADGDASKLYAQFGFEMMAPDSQGMKRTF